MLVLLGRLDRRGLIALLAGGAALAGVRAAAGNRLVVLAVLTLLATVVGGPLLVTIGVALSEVGTGNAGFLGLLFVIAIAGQLVALPLGVVLAAVHALLARFTAARG